MQKQASDIVVDHGRVNLLLKFTKAEYATKKDGSEIKSRCIAECEIWHIVDESDHSKNVLVESGYQISRSELTRFHRSKERSEYYQGDIVCPSHRDRVNQQDVFTCEADLTTYSDKYPFIRIFAPIKHIEGLTLSKQCA